eukprot:CAMPEP_0178533140 /NCGR_PEP_ID=MMETSP0696-20121128/34338_1 /TAXON_ID=265572 /ORGANISM="Extubocellulus spinifer, Strain CCMP396" /LENGTH=1545 /DNA_ID=CAMNT_0020165163 /DNA_START=231 /DNA_END=4866 /DNA_ORIENTATION=+
MPLSDLSPNLDRYACESPAPSSMIGGGGGGGGISSVRANGEMLEPSAGAGGGAGPSSSITKKAAPPSAPSSLRRSPRFHPSMLAEGGSLSRPPRYALAADVHSCSGAAVRNTSSNDDDGGAPAESTGTPAGSTTSASISAASDDVATLQRQLQEARRQLQEERRTAQSSQDVLAAVRALVIASSSEDGLPLEELRMLLGITTTSSGSTSKTGSGDGGSSASMAAGGLDPLGLIGEEEQDEDQREQDHQPQQLQRQQEATTGTTVKKKIVLDDDDDNNNDSDGSSFIDEEEDFVPSKNNGKNGAGTNTTTSKKTSQRRRTFAVQGNSLLLSKDPSPHVADTSPSDATSSTIRSANSNREQSSTTTTTTTTRSSAGTPSPGRPFDETPSKLSSCFSAGALSLPSTGGATGKSSSYSMTPDAETDDEEDEDGDEGQGGDLSTSYGNDDTSGAVGVAVSATVAENFASSSANNKMVLDEDEADAAMDEDNDEPYAERHVASRASVKKSDKKKRRKTIALKEDSLLRTKSPAGGGSSAGDSGSSPSPPIRKSAEAEWLPGSTSTSTSTPASANSGDSYSLAAKAKDSMQKFSSSYAGGGNNNVKVRRSERRRTLELQSQTNSLVLNASPAMSDTQSSLSLDQRDDDGDVALSGPPILPSPAPSDEVGSIFSRGTPLASVPEAKKAAPAAKAAAVAATSNDGAGPKPPLPPKRSSRRKSILPERLRQEDILLDPTLTPNSFKEGKKEEQASPPSSAAAVLPQPIEGDIAEEKATVKEAPASALATQHQKKRRRRSSVGIIAGGGLISAKEIEDLSAYAESKKRSKNSRKRGHEGTMETMSISAEETTSRIAEPKPELSVDECTPLSTGEEILSTIDDDAQQPDQVNVQDQPQVLQQEQPIGSKTKEIKVSIAGHEITIDACVVENEGIPHVDEAPADGFEPMSIEEAADTVDEASSSCASPEKRDMIGETVKEASAVLLAAPSPVIHEEEDPLGIKSLIPAPSTDALKDQSTAAAMDDSLLAFCFDDEAINARAIKKRIPQLFPGSDAITQPCASARIFACASIVLETSKANADGRAKRPASQLKYVLPTLDAFVKAELISLSGDDSAKTETTRPKVLQFSSFDGSATMPPVDRRNGSHSHLEKNIRSLEAVFKEINALAKHASTAKNDAIADEIKECLDAVIFTMRYIEQDSKENVRKELSESMPFHWPSQRFVKAAKTYRGELEDARLIIEDKSGMNTALRSRLGDFIGRAIRFYFRRFFDPVPLNLTNEHHANYRHVDLSGVRSRVCDIVEMTDPDGDGRDTAAADGSISSVFSYALRAVHALFAINAEKGGEAEMFSVFFSSEASKVGLGPSRAPTVVLSDSDVDDILADIHDVHIVLQGIKAAKFLRGLLHWPGVSAAIKDAGGWNKVETYASMFETLTLSNACPEEAYFTLLGNISSLLKRLDADAEAMADIERICEDSLRTCWKRFRCGTKSKAILQHNPHIATIAAYLRDGKSLSFPALAEPSEESSSEEEEEDLEMSIIICNTAAAAALLGANFVNWQQQLS